MTASIANAAAHPGRPSGSACGGPRPRARWWAGRWHFAPVVADAPLEVIYGLQACRPRKQLLRTACAGEPVPTLALGLPAGPHRLTGRMLGPDGEPLAERFGFSWAGERASTIASVATDAGGFLEFLGDRLPTEGVVTFQRANGVTLAVPVKPGRDGHDWTVGEVRWTTR